MRNGLGCLELKNGQRYEGDFLNNVIEGFGIFKRTNGEIY